MKKSTKIILAITIILSIIVAILSFVNINSAKNIGNDIVIYLGEEKIGSITTEYTENIKAIEFSSVRKSNGQTHEDYTFSGIALVDILNSMDIYKSEVNSVLMSSKDGYTVELTADEVFDNENVWLVWKMNNQPLDDIWGPYATIIRKDNFSQRWSKQLVKITLNK